jgi:hypothetical protein
MVNIARVQGGRQIQTGGILLIFRGFEFVTQRRNRVIGAVSGWALSNDLFAIPELSSGSSKYLQIYVPYLLRYITLKDRPPVLGYPYQAQVDHEHFWCRACHDARPYKPPKAIYADTDK